jgi:ribosomal protein L37E
MTRIDVCLRCGRRLVIHSKGLCASCKVYPIGQVTPDLWKNKSVRPPNPRPWPIPEARVA